MTSSTTTQRLTTTDVQVGEHTVTVTLRDGWPFITCWKCGGSGYLPGYEFSDNARCWGCGTRGGEQPADTQRRVAGITKDTDIEAVRQAAITARAKAIVQARRQQARAAEKAAAKVAKEREARDAAQVEIARIFDTHPAAVDATYFPNLEAGGARFDSIRGYAFISDRWMAGKSISDRMCEIAEETTKQIIAATQVTGLEAGKQRIEGTVKSIKWVDSSYGYHRSSTPKIVVELDSGQRVYGTCPAAILDQAHEGNGVVKGARIALTATVEVSGDDPTFGFFKNPSRPELVEAGVKDTDQD